jgi:hypothetical protein
VAASLVTAAVDESVELIDTVSATVAVVVAALDVSAVVVETAASVVVAVVVAVDVSAVVVEEEAAAVEVVVVKSLTTVATVLFTAETFKLTETEALAVDVDDDEVSSEVAVDE